MALVRIENLNGIALDWVLAHAENLPVELDPMGFAKTEPECSQAGYWVWDNDSHSGQMMLIGEGFSPSSKWVQGGEIIERENIELNPPCDESPEWTAKLQGGDLHQCGGTALEASMKVYVMSAMGEEVEVPDRLLAS